jgi:hypothetical protein
MEQLLGSIVLEFMGARDRIEIGLSYQPGGLRRLEESINGLKFKNTTSVDLSLSWIRIRHFRKISNANQIISDADP